MADDVFPELDPRLETDEDEQAQMEREVHRGHLAGQILSNPLWRELIEAHRQALFDEWAESDDEAVDRRELLRVRYKLILGFDQMIQEVSDSGKLSLARKDELESAGARRIPRRPAS